MQRAAVRLLAIALIGLSASEALALGANLPTGKPTERDRPDWPKGCVHLANDDNRVHGHWVNANDFFYFRGDASEFNDFLSRYARLPEIDPTLVLHVGKLPRIGPLGEKKTTPFNWKMEVSRRGWGTPADPRRPESDPGYAITIHVWLSDGIDLENLKVPKHVDLRSGGEIKEFIERHRGASK